MCIVVFNSHKSNAKLICYYKYINLKNYKYPVDE